MTVNSGLVSVIIYEISDSSFRRIISVSDNFSKRVLSRCFGGSLLVRMAMKIRLSIFSIISRIISVSSFV